MLRLARGVCAEATHRAQAHSTPGRPCLLLRSHSLSASAQHSRGTLLGPLAQARTQSDWKQEPCKHTLSALLPSLACYSLDYPHGPGEEQRQEGLQSNLSPLARAQTETSPRLSAVVSVCTQRRPLRMARGRRGRRSAAAEEERAKKRLNGGLTTGLGELGTGAGARREGEPSSGSVGNERREHGEPDRDREHEQRPNTGSGAGAQSREAEGAVLESKLEEHRPRAPEGPGLRPRMPV